MRKENKSNVRYGNFHRARKWHRKFDAVLYQGYIEKTSHTSDMFYKYESLIEFPTDIVKIRGINRLVKKRSV